MTGFSVSRYTTQIAVRLIKRWTGTNIHGASSPVSGGNADVIGMDAHLTGIDVARSGTSHETRSAIVPIADNDDIYKVRFKKRGMTKFKRMLVKARRLMRSLVHFIGELQSDKYSQDEKLHMLITLHEWKPELLDDHRREKEEHKLFRFHREQAKLLERQLIEILTNLGFCFHITKDERKYIKRRIKVAKVEVSPFAYIYHITSVPFGVKKTDMSQDWVATEIASSIGKKVRHELDLFGLRYTVEVGSTLSIPNLVSFADFNKMPKTMPPLCFYLGKTTNGTDVFRDLASAPHLIIAGMTGGGKSNGENGIICGFIMRNSPNIVKLVLFDLKGGVEFASFYGVPHLWQLPNDADGIIEYPEQVIPALHDILDECNRRLALLKKAKVKNIAEFNRGKHEKNKLPYIVAIFDEYTMARKLATEEIRIVDKKGKERIEIKQAGEKVEMLISTIANISRAAGIHFIIGTQYPRSDVLSTLISVNFPWRLAFNMSTAASQSVLSNWNATELTPVGRAIFQSSDGEIYIQTPRITPNTISSIVDDVKSGKGTITIRTVDPEELLEWALSNTGGKLDRDTLFNHFKDKITFAALNDLLHSMENKQFEVQGTLYIVRPPYANVARRIELVDVSQPTDGAHDAQHTTVTSDEKVTEEA